MGFKVYFQDDFVGEYKNGSFHLYTDNSFVQLMLRLPLEQFLESRVMPRSRWDLEAMDFYGLTEWDPLAICRLTHGMKMSDPMWLKFPEDPEDLDWATVQLQLW